MTSNLDDTEMISELEDRIVELNHARREGEKRNLLPEVFWESDGALWERDL